MCEKQGGRRKKGAGGGRGGGKGESGERDRQINRQIDSVSSDKIVRTSFCHLSSVITYTKKAKSSNASQQAQGEQGP